MPKILVTGGAGYIGSNTAHLLVRRGFDVLVVDDLSRGHAHNVSGIPFRQLNLSDTGALTDLLAQEKAHAVIHFAAYIAVGESTKKNRALFFKQRGRHHFLAGHDGAGESEASGVRYRR